MNSSTCSVNGCRIAGKTARGIEIPRISAGVIESIVMDALAKQADALALNDVARIVVGNELVSIELTLIKNDDGSSSQRPAIRIPVRLCSRGRERHIEVLGEEAVVREPDRALIKGLIRAYQWRERLASGEVKSIEVLARQEKLNATYVARLLPLTFLAPDIVTAVLGGRRLDTLTMAEIRSTTIPLNWDDQRHILALCME